MEGEAARFLLEGTQMSIKVMGYSVKEMQNLAALIKAALQKENLLGKDRLNNLLRSGAKLTVAQIPADRTNEFLKESRRHGLAFSLIKKKDTLSVAKIMFRQDDIEKFNAVIEEMGLLKDARVNKMSVDTRESVKDKLEHNAGRVRQDTGKGLDKVKEAYLKATGAGKGKRR
jgi:hypothetical protein